MRVGFAPKSLINVKRQDGRPAVVFEAEEALENVAVNGTPNQQLIAKATVVCLESQAKLYSIMLQYVEGAVVGQSDMDRLHEIVNSFRVAEEFDANKVVQEAMAEGREMWKHLVGKAGADILKQNFYVLIDRLSKLDLSQEKQVTMAMAETERFFKLADILEGDISPLEAFKQSWEKAQAGDNQDFKDEIRSAIDALITAA